MTLSFDHAIIAVNDLDTAVADYRALGFTVFYGGEHASATTHNALIVFQDGTYIELLAPTGKPRTNPDATDYSVLLQNGEGLAGYALLSDDLQADTAAMRERGVKIGEAQLGSRQRQDGTTIRWYSAFLPDSYSPFFIQDDTPRSLRVSDAKAHTQHENGVIGIVGVSFIVNDVSAAAERYHALLDVPAVTHEEGAHLALSDTTLTLLPPSYDHLTTRGDTPYSLMLLTGEPSRTGELPTAATHGARLELVSSSS